MNDRERIEAFLAIEIAAVEKARTEPDPGASLQHAAQATYWAVVLYDYLKKAEPRFMGHVNANAPDCLKGVRYIRNRLSHQFTLALDVTGGGAFPFALGGPLWEIVWKPLVSLPSADKGFMDAAGEAAYVAAMQGVPLRFTMDALKTFYDGAPR